MEARLVPATVAALVSLYKHWARCPELVHELKESRYWTRRADGKELKAPWMFAALLVVLLIDIQRLAGDLIDWRPRPSRLQHHDRYESSGRGALHGPTRQCESMADDVAHARRLSGSKYRLGMLEARSWRCRCLPSRDIANAAVV